MRSEGPRKECRLWREKLAIVRMYKQLTEVSLEIYEACMTKGKRKCPLELTSTPQNCQRLKNEEVSLRHCHH